MAKKKHGGVPYASPRANGLPGFRLQILDPETGKRLKPRDILPSEPEFYADEDELRRAHARLHDRLKLRLERGVTLRGFWEEWTDPDHWYWGTDATGRKVQSLATIKAGTKVFVDYFTEDTGGSPRIDAITPAQIEEWLKTNPAQSGILAVSSLFIAAIERDLITSNPMYEAAKKARKAQAKRRKQKERLGDNDAPTPEQIDELLNELGNPARYPYGLYAWFKTATTLGMRSGEIDAMRVCKLDLTDPSHATYRIDEQYHEDLNIFTEPKHDSIRTIRVPQLLLPTLERCAWEAKRIGSPFFFFNSRGEHWRTAARAYYWDDVDKRKRQVKGGRLGLRRVVSDRSMYCATRAYFATQAVLRAPDQIPMIAKHYGHGDNGKILLDFYARLTDKHGQDGMDVVYGRLFPDEPVRLADRRKAA